MKIRENNMGYHHEEVEIDESLGVKIMSPMSGLKYTDSISKYRSQFLYFSTVIGSHAMHTHKHSNFNPLSSEEAHHESTLQHHRA